MFKKRLKGLLAMVLAGSIATTTLPLSASATIDGNISVVGGGTVNPSDITPTDGVYGFAQPSSSYDAVSGYLNANNLWAIYGDVDGTESGFIFRTAQGDKLAAELGGLKDSPTGYENVEITNSHKVLVTTDNTVTTDLNVSGADDVENFPYIVNFSDYSFTPITNQLQEATWTVWYGEIYADTFCSVTKTASYAIQANSTELEIPMSTVENIYKPLPGGSTIPFGYGVTIIQLKNSYKTFDIPVLNTFGGQEMNGNTLKTIAITQGNTAPLDDGKKFYLCYGNEVLDGTVDSVDDVWGKIVALAGDDFDSSKLKLLRYAQVTVRSNGEEKGNFTSGEYYNYLNPGTPNTPNNEAIKYAFIDAKPKSIWSVVVPINGKRYSADKEHIDEAIGACLSENPKASTINFIEQTTINVTGTTPTAVDNIFSDKIITSQILKDNVSPKTISELLAELPAPASGKKYDLNGWQLWSASIGGSGDIYELHKIEFNTSGVTGVTAEMFNKAGYSKCPVIYFPQVDASSSGGSSGGSSSRPEPSYDPNKPTIDGEEKDWDDVAREIGKFSEGETKTIYLGRDKTIPADVIKAIKDSKAVITFKINSAFSWTVDGSTLTDGDIHDYDFSIEVITATGVEILRGDVGVGFKIGDISDGATLNINFKKEHAQKFANLYKKVDGELVFVDNVKIDENGAAIGLEVTEAGEYVVMLGKMSDRPGDMDNDGIMNAKDSLAILKDFLGMESGANPLVSDMNGDSFINAKDALIIVKKSVGIE